MTVLIFFFSIYIIYAQNFVKKHKKKKKKEILGTIKALGLGAESFLKEVSVA